MRRSISSIALLTVLLVSTACTKDESEQNDDPQTEVSGDQNAADESERAVNESGLAEVAEDEQAGADVVAGNERAGAEMPGNVPATGRAGEMQRATEKACEKTFDCAIATMPENMRSVISKEQICGAFHGYSSDFALDTVTAPCFRAALAYLSCVGESSCEELTSSEGEVCKAAALDAQSKCEDEQADSED